MQKSQKQTKKVVSTSKRRKRRPRGQKKGTVTENYNAIQRVKAPRKGTLHLNAPQSGVQFSTNSVWETKKAQTAGGMRIMGREYGGTLYSINPDGTTNIAYWTPPIPIAVPTNSIQPLHPRVLSRLAALCDVYEFYKFHGLRIYGNSMKATTSTGSISVGIEPQYSDCLGTESSSATNSVVMALPSAITTNIYADFVCTYTPEWARGKDLRFATDLDLGAVALSTGLLALADQQSQLGFRCVYNGHTATGTDTSHILQIEYDVEFMGPKFGVSGAGLRRHLLQSGEKTPVKEPLGIKSEGVGNKELSCCPPEHLAVKEEITTQKKDLNTKVDGSITECTCVPGKDQLCYCCYLKLRFKASTPT